MNDYGEQKKPVKLKNVTVNVRFSQYPVIPKAAKSIGWRVSTEEPRGENWDVYWCDSGQGIDKTIRVAKSFQRINHFSGMVQIYRKNQLAKSLAKMQRFNGAEYNFAPKTWTLPFDLQDISRYLHAKKENCVIIKPVAGAQGRGISLAMASNFADPLERCVVQAYVNRPLLIDGFKFDMRIYVLVVSCDPLRVLLYREGLCRLCTTPYCAPNDENIDNTFMHLTNYSVNKHNENFMQNNGDSEDEDSSSKRSLSWLWTSLAAQGRDVAPIWPKIADIIVKTLISVQAPLAFNFDNCKVDGQNKNPFTCFELLGFDIMLTEDLTPVLIEVNHMPSFKTDSVLDRNVKQPLIENTLSLINASSDERQRYLTGKQLSSQSRLYGDLQDDHLRRKADTYAAYESPEEYWRRYLLNERRNIGNFQLIYPTDCYAHQPTRGRQEVYDTLLEQAAVVFELTRGAGRGSADYVGDSSDVDDDSVAGSFSPQNSSRRRVQIQDSPNNGDALSRSGSFASYAHSPTVSGGMAVVDNSSSQRAQYVQSVIERSNKLLATMHNFNGSALSPTVRALAEVPMKRHSPKQNQVEVVPVSEDNTIRFSPVDLTLAAVPPPEPTPHRDITTAALRTDIESILQNNRQLIRNIDSIQSTAAAAAARDAYEPPVPVPIPAESYAINSPARFAPTKPAALMMSPGRASNQMHRKVSSGIHSVSFSEDSSASSPATNLAVSFSSAPAPTQPSTSNSNKLKIKTTSFTAKATRTTSTAGSKTTSAAAVHLPSLPQRHAINQYMERAGTAALVKVVRDGDPLSAQHLLSLDHHELLASIHSNLEAISRNDYDSSRAAYNASIAVVSESKRPIPEFGAEQYFSAETGEGEYEEVEQSTNFKYSSSGPVRVKANQDSEVNNEGEGKQYEEGDNNGSEFKSPVQVLQQRQRLSSGDSDDLECQSLAATITYASAVRSRAAVDSSDMHRPASSHIAAGALGFLSNPLNLSGEVGSGEEESPQNDFQDFSSLQSELDSVSARLQALSAPLEKVSVSIGNVGYSAQRPNSELDGILPVLKTGEVKESKLVEPYETERMYREYQQYRQQYLQDYRSSVAGGANKVVR